MGRRVVYNCDWCWFATDEYGDGVYPPTPFPGGLDEVKLVGDVGPTLLCEDCRSALADFTAASKAHCQRSYRVTEPVEEDDDERTISK